MDALKGSSRQLLQTLLKDLDTDTRNSSTPRFLHKLRIILHWYLQAYPGMQLRIEEEFGKRSHLVR